MESDFKKDLKLIQILMLLTFFIVCLPLALILASDNQKEPGKKAAAPKAITTGAIETQSKKAVNEITPKVVKASTVEKQTQKTKPFFVALTVRMKPELQKKIFDICQKKDISFAFLMAMIKQESSFHSDAIGDHGHAFGLLQIQPRWHQERMKKVNATNLLDPIDNINVATSLLVELFKAHDDVDRVLMAYNLGGHDARELWQQGINQTEYSRTIEKTAAAYEKYIDRRNGNG